MSIKGRLPGMYWLLETRVQDGTMYCQIPPRSGYPMGFTFDPNEAYAWKSKWRALLVVWRLRRRGLPVYIAQHQWI